jgi:hypothetical protein
MPLRQGSSEFIEGFRTNGNGLVPFVVSLSGHKWNQPIQRFLNFFVHDKNSINIKHDIAYIFVISTNGRNLNFQWLKISHYRSK